VRKVLLTGAGGRIGTSFRQYASQHYALRLVDVRGEKIGDPGRHEVVEADLADPDVCQRLCAGMETVVHLAADPSPRADFYGSLLDNNIKAVYNIFRAAKDQGCRRVIFASSIQVIEGYPMDVQARPEMPVKPLNMYAVCKSFGEATAHYFAHAEGLSSIAVRIGAYGGNGQIENSDARTLCCYVSPRDLNHLLEQCIETPGVQFAIVQAVSDNRFKRMDITSTREVVGYNPQDDAFELFNTGIHDRERWYQEWNRGERKRA
jgi:nucleoside-diphosphate-sugar epimerase